MTRRLRPSSRCRAGAGAIPKPSPRRYGRPYALRSVPRGTRSPHATCTCSRCDRARRWSALAAADQAGYGWTAGDDYDRTAQPCGDRGSRHRQGRECLSPDPRRSSFRPVPQPDHGVTTVFITLPNTKIELLEPLGEASPITKFLDRNPDGGIHHVCYEVDDIRAARERLKAQGARVLGDGEAKIGAHGKPVLFLHPKDFCGTMVEIEEA